MEIKSNTKQSDEKLNKEHSSIYEEAYSGLGSFGEVGIEMK